MEGLEEAWVSGGLECIAVKGNLAAYVTVLGQDRRMKRHWRQALCALAECWADEEK